MNPLKDNKPKNKDQRKKKKRNALIICHNETQFWTTQSQFWQWVRELKIVKLKDNPLTGKFTRPHEELMVEIGHTILNLAHQNHLHETLASRRYIKQR